MYIKNNPIPNATMTSGTQTVNKKGIVAEKDNATKNFLSHAATVSISQAGLASSKEERLAKKLDVAETHGAQGELQQAKSEDDQIAYLRNEVQATQEKLKDEGLSDADKTALQKKLEDLQTNLYSRSSLDRREKEQTELSALKDKAVNYMETYEGGDRNKKEDVERAYHGGPYKDAISAYEKRLKATEKEVIKDRLDRNNLEKRAESEKSISTKDASETVDKMISALSTAIQKELDISQTQNEATLQNPHTTSNGSPAADDLNATVITPMHRQ